jgi:hypothetical protein
VSEPAQLSVICEQGEDGFVLARIRELPASMSQGRAREEARENVLDALRELVLLSRGRGARSAPPGVTSEALRITVTSSGAATSSST